MSVITASGRDAFRNWLHAVINMRGQVERVLEKANRSQEANDERCP